jgi:DNA-binding response OmpR family regulator
VGQHRQALQLGGQPGLALIIVDLKLPDLDGLEVLAGLRARGRGSRCSYSAPRGRVHDRVRGLDLGADDYLAKPCAFEALRARVPGPAPPRFCCRGRPAPHRRSASASKPVK